ncbi:MAG: hypothetical protein ACK6D3_13685 [Planctomycetaceae bacterium]
MDSLIRCAVCRVMLPTSWPWHICNQCGFRVCPNCLGNHKGDFSLGGYKCSQCPHGTMEHRR